MKRIHTCIHCIEPIHPFASICHHCNRSQISKIWFQSLPVWEVLGVIAAYLALVLSFVQAIHADDTLKQTRKLYDQMQKKKLAADEIHKRINADFAEFEKMYREIVKAQNAAP